MWETGTLMQCWCRSIKWCSCFWKIVWKFSHRIKHGVTQDWVIPLLSIYQEVEMCLLKNCTQMFIAAFVMLARWEAIQLSISEWMDKMWISYIGVLVTLKRDEVLTYTAAWWTFETLSCVEEVTQKRSHIVQFHLHKVTDVGKPIETESRFVVVMDLR